MSFNELLAVPLEIKPYFKLCRARAAMAVVKKKDQTQRQNMNREPQLKRCMIH